MLEVVDERFGRAVGNKSARAEPALDEGLQFHYAQRFTQSGATDLQTFRELSLRWETIAGLEFPLPDQSGESYNDRFVEACFSFLSHLNPCRYLT